MWRFIQNMITPPVFPGDEEKTRIAKLLNTLLLMLFLFPALAIVNIILLPSILLFAGVLLFFLLSSLIGLMVALRRGYVQQSSSFLLVLLLVAFGYLIYSEAGQTRPFITLITSVIIIGGLLLGNRGAIVAALALSLITGVMYYLAATGLVVPLDTKAAPFSSWLVTSTGYLVSGMLLALASTSLQDALKRARSNQEKLLVTNHELQETQNTLEQRVAQRTSELQERSTELGQLSQRLERRANGLQAVALVGREITSIQSIDELLPRVAQVTGKQFGFYHVGIFIVDKEREIAVLKAANSAGGQKMLLRNHQLKIGETGIVGFVAGVGRPRIALKARADTTFFNNPDLPETRSEMALPFKIGNEVIGVLDVQSEQEGAFSEEDTELLTIVADQISIAIQNARLFTESQKATADALAITRQYVRQEWQSVAKEETIGYRFSQAGIQPIFNDTGTTTLDQIEAHEQQPDRNMLIPIKVHDQTIGALKLQSQIERTWDQDTIDIAQAVADRVALAIENTRLLERSQSQAARERAISEITAKIGASVNMRNVLQTAVEELGRVLPGSDVVIQIENKR